MNRYRRYSLLATIAVFFIVIGVIFGNYMSDSSNSKALPLRNNPQSENTSPLKWSGIVRKVAALDGSTQHVLESGTGETLASLQSQKIDLNFLEGLKVSIEGKKLRGGSESKVPTISVEKVNFK